MLDYGKKSGYSSFSHCQFTNQKGETVIEGAAEITASRQKVCRERIPLPDFEIHESYQK